MLMKYSPEKIPTPTTISKTHVLLGSIAEKDPERVFGLLQGDNWSPRGEARNLVRKLNLSHTSMSVGDIVQIGNKLWIADNIGFKELKPMPMMEAVRLTLPTNVKKRLNDRLYDLVLNKYFDKIPLRDICNILDSSNIIMLDEDNTEWSGLLLGREGRLKANLASKENRGGTDATPTYTPYSNTILIMTWYKMPSGKYEIVVYVS